MIGTTYENKRIIELCEDEIGTWDEITQCFPDFRSPFFSSAFSRAVAQAAPDDCYVTLVRNADRITGIFPYQFVRRRLGDAGRIGLHLSDYNGILIRKDSDWNINQLLRASKVNGYSFDHLHESQKRYGLPGEFVRKACRINLTGGIGQYWADMETSNKRLLKDTRRRKKKFEGLCGEYRFRPAVDSFERLSLCLEMKREQYRKTGVNDVLSEPWTTDALRNLFSLKGGFARAVLSEISTVDGQVVAMHFGLLANGILHYWFPVYNAQFSEFAPGRLLLSEIIDAAESMGIQEIDRGMGVGKYKTVFANEFYLLGVGAWRRKTVVSQYLRLEGFVKNRLLGAGRGGARQTKLSANES